MTFEQWKLMFSFYMMKEFEAVNIPKQHWYSNVMGELSTWEKDVLSENPIMDWKNTKPEDAVKEALSYWGEQ